MMKKLWILFGLMALCLCACVANTTENTEFHSDLYTDREIHAAIDTAIDYFDAEFSGCTLTEITYAGDEQTKAHAEWASRNDADEAIVLISSFDVDASGGDGSLNPNSTYSNWMWILVRDHGGAWYHADHGY